MKALLLAAGKGERLRPQTLQLAKPALPLLNVPMLGYATYLLELLGAKEFIINTHHLPESIETAARQIISRKFPLQFSFEKEILGSGGGLARAMRLAGPTNDPLLVANADAVMLLKEPGSIVTMLESHRKSGAIATLLLSPFPSAAESFGGVYVDKDSRIKKFSKTKIVDSSLVPWHFTGILILEPTILTGLSEDPSNLLYDILQPRMDKGELVNSVIVKDGAWFETGNLRDYLATTQSLLEILGGESPLKFNLIKILDRYTPNWWKGWRLPSAKSGALLASLPWPDRIHVDDFAVIGGEAMIGEGVNLKRSVIAGAAIIDPGKSIQSQFIVARSERDQSEGLKE